MTNWARQVILLHLDSNPVVDSSPDPIHFDMNNSPGCSTANPKVGSGSLVCVPDAYPNFKIIAFGNEPKFLIGLDDFYFSAWVWFDQLVGNYGSGDQYVFDCRGDTDFGPYVHLNNQQKWVYGDGSFIQPEGTGLDPAKLHTWYLVELRRVSGVGTLYIDRQIAATTTMDGNYVNHKMVVGSAWFTPLGIDSLGGYIDEFSVRIGVENIPVIPKLMSGLSNFSRLIRA